MNARQQAPDSHAAAFRRVWLLAIAMIVIATLVFINYVVPVPVHSRPLTIPWVLLAAAFYLTEIKVVHIHFRRETQAFSLSEAPLVLGMFFTDPPMVVAAAVLGAVAALVLSRGQNGVKLVLNSAHVMLGNTAAVALFHALQSNPDGLSPSSWLVAGLAAIMASMVNLSAIFTAISLSEGKAEFSKLPEVMIAAVAGTATTASLAMVSVVLLWEVPQATSLIAIPAVMVYLAFSAYTAEKDKSKSLAFLYESSKILQGAPEVGDAIGALIHEAQRSFRSEIAEATLYPATEGDPAVRASVLIGDDVPKTHTLAMNELERGLQRAVEASGASLVTGHEVMPDIESSNPFAKYVASRKLRDAMIVPLRGETRVIGCLMLANRVGQVSPYREDELRLFETLANNASVSLENNRLERTLSELSELKETLRHRADHDPLTGLANRSLFAQTVADLLAMEGPDARTISVFYLDLDDFKSINDSFGHDAGDELLIELSERIKKSLRPGDMAARLGGDEFAVIIDRVDNVRTPVAVAERILEAVRVPVKLADRELHVRTSLGLALSGGITPQELIRNADAAMYWAKHRSKGNYAIFEPGMHQDLTDRLELKGELMVGVEAEQFVVHYQPLISLGSGAIVGMEALVRWDHPERGIVSPGDFIDLAEETGLVLPIGDLVLEAAVKQLASWQRDWSPDLVMSVNISARQLKQPALVRRVEEVLRQTGVEPSTLILEITERDVMDDTEKSMDRLTQLKALGVQIAIDDFGTGYSSLAYLRKFPIDVVKIAKEFVDVIINPDDEGVLAHAIVDLSSALGMATIAEGIEFPDQARRLAGWDCGVGQGWLWSRAEPAAEVESLLRKGLIYRAADGPNLLPGKGHPKTRQTANP